MSESFDKSMYAFGDEAAPEAAPSLVSNQRVSLSVAGNFRKLEVDGETLLVVDPKTVQSIEQRLRTSEQLITDLHNKLARTDQQMRQLTKKIDVLSSTLNRMVIGND